MGRGVAAWKAHSPPMNGFCESCGRYSGPWERLRRGGLVRDKAGVYLCPGCRNPGIATHVPAGTVSRVLDGLVQRGPVLLAVGATTVTILAALQLALAVISPPAGGGGVLGVTQLGTTPSPPQSSGRRSEPSADRSSPAAATSSPSAVSPSAASAPNGPSASATDEPAATDGGGEPAFTVEQAVIRSWQGPYGETRLQIIVRVRNDDARWLGLPRSNSTYRVIDGNGLEVASGVFTAALPAAVEPGGTGYLVDTVSVSFLEPTGEESVAAEVLATAVEPTAATLLVSDLSVTSGTGDGLRVNGRVHNQGPVATQWIMAGAIALARDGSPLGAVYDPSDIGRLEPGQALPFETEYPGAPPLARGDVAELIGFAFEAEP